MKSLLLIVFSTLSFFAIAQSPSFSIHGGPAFAITSTENITNEINLFNTLNDSVGFSIPSIQEISFEIKDKIGFNLGGKVHFKLGKKWGLSTGLNFAWSGFNVLAESGPLVPVEGGDTTFVTLNPNPINLPNSCTEYESVASFNDRDPSIDISMLHLQIPLDFTYHLSSAFQVSAGLMFSTPLFTQSSQDVFSFNRREEIDANGNLHIICRTDLERANDRSGNNFNNSVFHFRLGADYQITPNISIGTQLSGNFNSLFSGSEQPEFFLGSDAIFQVEKMNIYRAALNVRYTFGPKKPEES